MSHPIYLSYNIAVNTEQKLDILAESSRFDLSCACKFPDEPGRIRGSQGRWIYPTAMPSGRKVFLLKTLQSNACVNDCSYCPFNKNRDLPRCHLQSEQLARIFMEMVQANLVSGLFLSSGVVGTPDETMAQMLETVETLRRRHKFRGYIHLKIIPGASQSAIEKALQTATRVSVNIEAPNAERLGRLASKKRFHQDIISAMDTVRRLCQQNHIRCNQTTQFVVGAAGETDREIVLATDRLYQKFDMARVYFSAYQNFDNCAEASPNMLFPDITQESEAMQDTYVREHRLYQVDFLFRRYKFSREDIFFDEKGNLPLGSDPKLVWAQYHPEFYPVNVNRSDPWQLLRVPGIGPVGAKRILSARRQMRINRWTDLNQLGIRLKQAKSYLTLS